ncbi:O-antigen ligase family protein [Helicobacter brantae]|uniref:O-antigen ligase family protein n=1 Tax=Helicobacter brantae TaxID=375927 RepID=UPI001472A5DA|nr:O-antigen ligase family protein [Helicobacter brantae]
MFLKLKFNLNKRIIAYCVGIGAIINGCFALYERYILGMQRVDAFVGIAEMATASSLLCLFSVIFYAFSTSKKEQIFFAIASLFAFSASFSTAARSAMISLLIAFCILQIVFLFKNKRMFKKTFVAIGGMLIVFSLLWAFPVGKDTFRLQQIQVDIDQYAKDNPQTSIGMRFEMWKEAWTMLKISPVYGMSTAMIAKRTNEIIQKSGSRIRSENDLGVRGTKHSQIMEALAKRGIVGLLALLLFWWTSLRMFGYNLSQCQGEELKYRICGFLTILYFIFINSFTGEPWDSMVDTPMIILLCSLFLKFINQETNEKENFSHYHC